MAVINIRIDDKLKHDAEKVLNELGLTVSDAVRVYFSKIKNTKGIPFEMKIDKTEIWDHDTAIREALKDVKDGRISKSYTDMKN